MVLKLSKWQKICLKKKYKRPTDWNLSNKMRKCQKSKKEYRWKEKCIQKMWGTNKKKNVEFKKLEKTKITEESEKVDWRIKEKEIQVKKENKKQFKKCSSFSEENVKFRRKFTYLTKFSMQKHVNLKPIVRTYKHPTTLIKDH